MKLEDGGEGKMGRMLDVRMLWGGEDGGGGRLISLPRRNASAAPSPGQCLYSTAEPTARGSIQD